MKTPQNIRDLLGLRQDELALLLNVSRSQFSKFELGTRDLPLSAKILLAEMLQYVQSPESNDKVLKHLPQQEKHKKQHLEKLMRENEYQLLLLEKKMHAVQKKYNNSVAALKLSGFLKNQPHHKSKLSNAYLENIAAKASRVLSENNLALQTTHQIKKEVLEFEKLLLYYAMQKTA